MTASLPINNRLAAAWKILIIDDDEEDYLIIKDMLKAAQGQKFDMRWVSTYEDGHRELMQDHYDAVLVDYDIGYRTGIDLIREANERGYPSPLILFTGRGSYEIDVEAMQAGATLYLTKNEVNPLTLERFIRYAIERKRIERERSDILESIQDGFFSVDKDWKITYINRRAARNSKFEPADAVGRSVWEVFPNLAGTPAVEYYQSVMENQQAVKFEMQVPGDRRWYAVSVYPSIEGISVYWQDITEKRKADEKIAYHASLLDHIHDAIIANDVDQRITAWNQAAEKLYGFTVEEAVGHVHGELLHSELTFERRAAILEQLAECGECALEVVQYTKDGRRIIVEGKTISLHDSQGNVTGYVTANRDITDRKLAEQAHHESETRWREFLESTHDNYIALDREWRFTYVNRHYGEVMGRNPNELIGKNYWELFPLYLGTELEQNYRKVMEEGVPLHYHQKGIYTSNFYEVSVYPTNEGLAIFSIERTEELRNQYQLESERARLEEVLQALPVGVWITDEDGKIIKKNKQADLIWAGEAPLLESIDQYQEYTAWYQNTGEKVPAEEYPVARALLTQQPVEPVELHIQRFDGSHGTMLVSAAPIRDKEGHLTGVVGINVDITERKQTEVALRESSAALRERNKTLELERAKLAAVIDYLPVGIAIGDAQGNFLSMNSSCLEVHGFADEAEMLSRVENYLQDFELRSLDGASIPVDQWPAARALRGDFVRSEEVLLHSLRSGINRVISYSTIPVRDSGDQILLIVYVLEDLTERHRAEAAVWDSEVHFSQLADSMPQLVWTAKSDGTVDYYNVRHHEYEGIAPGEGEDWQWGPVLHPDDLEPTLEAWNRAVQTGQMYQIEHRVRMSDGTFRWHLSRGIPVKDQEGKITRWYGTATDIEEQKQNEARLRRSNEELEQFAFVASHDLQEPLRKIIMFGESLQRHFNQTTDGEARDYLSRMQNAAKRMQMMINGLLELSRVNTRGADFTPIDLNEVAAEVVYDLELRIQAVQGAVFVEPLPVVHGDGLQIRQLFQNLIINALKFHRPEVPPVVRISGKVVQRQKMPVVEIRVEDNGIGFDPQYVERIFQPFQRLHGRSNYEGTGLGLSICQRIVERHQGAIEVDSTPGEGSVFTIRLPYLPA